MQYLSRNKVLAMVLTASLMMALLVPSLAMETNLFGARSGDKAALSQSAASAIPAEETVSRGKTTQSTRSTAQKVASVQADTDTNVRAADPEIRYFPVTLYDYNEDYNNAMHRMEVDAALAGDGIGSLTQWDGIYFGGNGLGANVRDSDAFVYGEGETTYTYPPAEPVSYKSSGNYSSYTGGDYYHLYNGQYYVVTALSCVRSGSIFNRKYTWTITFAIDGTTDTDTKTVSELTLYTRQTTTTGTSTDALPYAEWNNWTGHVTRIDSNGNSVAKHGNKTYGGLVENNLVNGLPVFTKSEAGIFNEDTTVKKIYKNVGVPARYGSDGYYTFDSDEFAAYFHTDATQGTSATPASNSNLYYNLNNKQTGYIDGSTTPGFNAQDGSVYGWFPFSDTERITENTNEEDYFFGMRASIPFSMTTHGTVSSTNNTPITFNFSGDDDVWVFIDGVLVLDIGGVHNKINGNLNFAENTWSITAATETIGGSSRPAIDVNGGALSGYLFNEGTNTGVLNQTRESFAAKDSHELTIFYLERGSGSSNCKIKFNLPQKDSLIVRKAVAETDSAGAALAPDVLAAVNEQSFGFKLYKMSGTAFAVVANADYRVYNGGNYVRTATTAADGSFSLKNGESARFVGEIAATGDSYYVVEDTKTGFETPVYAFTSNRDVTVNQQQNGWKSHELTIAGTDDTDDLTIICTNTLTHVNNLTLNVEGEQIVADYGLPVNVDILKNDVVLEGSITGVALSADALRFGTAVIENNRLIYTPNRQMTGVETINYTVTAQSNDGNQTETKSAYLTVIPATTMYYEENFGNLVTYTGAWSPVGTARGGYQEAGFVGGGSSPYGSDPAYLNDSADSNGASMYVQTTNAAASFTYDFIGTGTTFFARTTNNSGYIRVVLTKLDNAGNGTAEEKTYQRNIAFKTTDNSIVNYNIPVFTETDLIYGHYRVTVYIAKKTGPFGDEFWLDGIRVINPIDPTGTDADTATALAAYASDYESNNSIVTIREKLLNDETTQDGNDNPVWKDTAGFVLFTDSDGAMVSAADYKSNGPKEEVYLNVGQSISFSLTGFDVNSQYLYVGLKAPRGQAQVQIGSKTLILANTADCFYKLDADCMTVTEVAGVKVATVTISAVDGLVSATNIKATGNESFVIVDQANVLVDTVIEN